MLGFEKSFPATHRQAEVSRNPKMREAMRSLFVFAFVMSALGCASTGNGIQTSAPPEVQKEIQGVLSMMGRARLQCDKAPRVEVLSVEVSEDAEFDDTNAMTAGSVKEVWVAKHCQKSARYSFLIGPNQSGAMSLLGWESLGIE